MDGSVTQITLILATKQSTSNTNFYALHSASPYISYVVICVVIPTRKQEFISENWTKNTQI